jgi:apolipoprotein N-acyltransferase
MITVTGLIFAVVLAPTMQLRGWENASNALEHYITPILTIVVFIVFGPRRQLNYRLVLPALILPLTWVVLVMIRGAIIDAYPYGFVNAAEWGYGTVVMNIFGVVVFGILLGLVFVAIDRARGKRQRAS